MDSHRLRAFARGLLLQRGKEPIVSGFWLQLLVEDLGFPVALGIRAARILVAGHEDDEVDDILVLQGDAHQAFIDLGLVIQTPPQLLVPPCRPEIEVREPERDVYLGEVDEKALGGEALDVPVYVPEICAQIAEVAVSSGTAGIHLMKLEADAIDGYAFLAQSDDGVVEELALFYAIGARAPAVFFVVEIIQEEQRIGIRPPGR